MREPWTGELVGIMHNHNITASDIAEVLGVSKQYVSMCLNGLRKPPNIQERLEGAVKVIIRQRG